MRLAILLTVAAGALGLAAAAPSRAQQPAAKSVWDGVYTANQARRGALKSGLCTECHGDGFVDGPAPTLVGPDFFYRWEGKSVGDLFDLIRLTMPDNDPGALSREEYADLVAYILALNKFPAGTVEVPTSIDPMRTIRILETRP
jgi:mono/diheme cytochrome c family protein